MNKTVKIISILLIAIILVATLATVSQATEFKPGEMVGQIKPTTSDAQQSVQSLGNQIVGIITTVGVVVAVVVLLILGIKYMMGSASEKAEYKKTMIPYLVGAILIFGASAITKVIVGLAAGIATT